MHNYYKVESKYLDNFLDFGFIELEENFLTFRLWTIDIKNNILISPNNMYRFKNLQEMWNYFITLY